MSKWSVLLISALLLLPAIKVSAQEQKEYSRFEVSLFTGYNGLLFYGDEVSYVSDFWKLFYDVTFRYYPKSWISVGLSAGNSLHIYENTGLRILVTPSVHFHWLRKSCFTAYSGIGYCIPTSIDDWEDPYYKKNWYQGFQYTPIGITFGRSLFGLAELGYGPRYFPLRLGIGYRF